MSNISKNIDFAQKIQEINVLPLNDKQNYIKIFIVSQIK